MDNNADVLKATTITDFYDNEEDTNALGVITLSKNMMFYNLPFCSQSGNKIYGFYEHVHTWWSFLNRYLSLGIKYEDFANSNSQFIDFRNAIKQKLQEIYHTDFVADYFLVYIRHMIFGPYRNCFIYLPLVINNYQKRELLNIRDELSQKEVECICFFTNFNPRTMGSENIKLSKEFSIDEAIAFLEANGRIIDYNPSWPEHEVIPDIPLEQSQARK